MSEISEQDDPETWAKKEWMQNSEFWLKTQRESKGLLKALADFVIGEGQKSSR